MCHPCSRSAVFFLATFACFSSDAHAQFSWLGGCGGSEWYEACIIPNACGPNASGCLNNWFTAPACGPACPLSFPGPGHSVVISTGSGVSLTGAASIASLNCLRPFTLNGTLTVDGNAIFNGTLTWTSDGMLGEGVTFSNATMYIVGPNTKSLQQRLLRTNGTTIWMGTGTLDLSDGAKIENQDAFLVESNALMSFTFGIPAVFENVGSFSKQNSFGETIIQGVIFYNSGTVNVFSGTLRLATSGSSTGPFVLADNTILELNNSYTFDAGTSVTGDGVLQIDGAALTVAADVITTETELVAGSIGGPGTFTCNLIWTGGSMIGPGATVVAGNSQILESTTKALNGRSLTNLNSMVWHDNGTLDLTNGAAISNQSFFSIRGNATLTHSTGAPSSFYNTGTLEKRTSTGTTLVQSVMLNNAGTVDVRTGTLRLASNSTSSGLMSIADGAALEMASGNHTFNAGASISGDGTLVIDGGALTVASDVTAGETEFAGGAIGGPGVFTCNLVWTGGSMLGPGTTALIGNSQILDATLKTLNARTLLNTSNTTWYDDGTLDLVNGATINNQGFFSIRGSATLTHSSGATSSINNSGTLEKRTSAGTALIQNVVFNNPGTVDVQTGTLRLTNTGTSTGTFVVAAGAKVEMASGSHTLDGADQTGDGSLRLTGATVSIVNEVTATNIALASGVLTGAGLLSCGNTLTWTSGLMSGGGETRIEETATATLSGGFLKSAQQRVITNEGSLDWLDGGTLDLSNGATFINIGSFKVLSDAVVNFSFGSPVVFINLGVFTKLNSGGETQFVGVPLNNSGTIQVQTGTLRVFSPYTQTGGSLLVSGGATFRSTPTINLQGGVLGGSGTVNGSVQNTGAVVAPGAPIGLLTITGNYTKTAGGTLTIEVGGTAAPQYDRLAVNGNANLGGTLRMQPVNGFLPQVGQQFTVMTYGARTGQFASVVGPGQYTVTYNPTNVTLTVLSMPQMGDLNCDGFINGRDIDGFVLAATGTPPDFNEYTARYSNCNPALGDLNGTGTVDPLDVVPFVSLFMGP